MGAEDFDDLEECWRDLRPRAQPLTAKWHPPPRPHVEQWVGGLGQKTNPVFSVKGPSPVHRMEVYRWISPMVEVDPCKSTEEWWHDLWGYLVSQVGGPGPWDLLWNLLDVQEFIVEEPLRGLVDQGFLFTEFYQALWEARFLLQESAPGVTDLVEALIRWMTQPELDPEDRKRLGKLRLSRPLQSDGERLDMLFFLLALAGQNGTIKPVVVVLDELGKATLAGQQTRRKVLADLLQLVLAAERWNRLGAAFGLVVGFSPGVLTSLRKYNPKLGKKVSSGIPEYREDASDARAASSNSTASSGKADG